MDDDTLMTAKEINEFKSRIQGTHLLWWLKQLPDFPKVMDSCDVELVEQTVLGQCRRWGEDPDYRRGRSATRRERTGARPLPKVQQRSQGHSGSPSSGLGGEDDPTDQEIRGLIDEQRKRAMRKAVALLKWGHGRRSQAIRDNARLGTSTAGWHLEQAGYRDGLAIPSFPSGCRRWRTSCDVCTGQWAPPARLPECRRRGGRHGPRHAASQWAGVLVRSGGEPVCEGVGHLRRHHEHRGIMRTGKGCGKAIKGGSRQRRRQEGQEAVEGRPKPETESRGNARGTHRD